eukprot:5207149-Amphidinium_carterae.5
MAQGTCTTACRALENRMAVSHCVKHLFFGGELKSDLKVDGVDTALDTALPGTPEAGSEDGCDP